MEAVAYTSRIREGEIRPAGANGSSRSANRVSLLLDVPDPAGDALVEEEGPDFFLGRGHTRHRAFERSLIVEPAERATIALAVSLRQHGASLRRICAELERAGHRPKRGQRWHPTVVSRLLHREGVTADS